MRLSQNLNDALNIQVAHELRNSIIYMKIASFFEIMQLKNLSHYFMDRSNEEKSHADKFLNYINDRTGGVVSFSEAEESYSALVDVSAVADAYVKTEEFTTESIESIYGLALAESSYMDLGFLQEMLNEQIQEEDESNSFSVKIKAVKDLVLFDATFGK